MALFLYRVGQTAFQHRRLVLGLWVADPRRREPGRGDARGTQLNELLHPRHRGAAGHRHAPGALPGRERRGRLRASRLRCARGRFARRSRRTWPGWRDVLAAVAANPKVGAVSDPFTTGTVSPDGRVALAQVAYTVPITGMTDDDREALLEAVAAGRTTGLTVEVGGPALQPIPEQGLSEAIGIADRGRRPAHHVRVLHRRRSAAADRPVRHRHRRRADHRGQRLRVAERHDLDSWQS